MLFAILLAILQLSCSGEQLIPEGNGTAAEVSMGAKEKSYLLYTSFFLERRKEQLRGAAELRARDDYSRQFEIIKRTMDTIFKLLNSSWSDVKRTGLSPPQRTMPDHPALQEVVGSILENTAFVGDFAIQLPEITQRILKRNKEWGIILKWAVEFCNQSSVYQDNESHTIHLKLLSQELGLVPPDPNLHNPFRVEKEEEKKEEEARKENKKREKREKKKGPQLQGARHEL